MHLRLQVGGSAPRMVKCPACGGPSVFAPQNRHRPFCSERCRMHDLGAWASERYRVSADSDAKDAGEPLDDPDGRH